MNFIFAGCVAVAATIGACLIAVGGADAGYATNGSTFSAPRNVLAGRGVFAHLEARFDLPNLSGNPFDYTVNDVRVRLALPGGKTTIVPAFFDGGTTWRVRYTPAARGAYRITGVTRNNAPISAKGLTPQAFTVSGKPTGPGFVRLDPRNPVRFAFDNGAAYYPIGFNVAWGSKTPGDIIAAFDKMRPTGANWSRVWMNHWDNKNIDWEPGLQKKFDQYDLESARKWDAIVAAGERDGVRFQMVLQHHGPYTTTVNPNWDENPWNAKNGGFLQTPDEFFTNPRALALTRAKYRYIVARYGYSPAVLSWELFNEVEWTNQLRKDPAVVAKWHRDMATFLRAQDNQKHLVTTSSDVKIPGLYDAMDYVQPHAYPNDATGAIKAHSVKTWKKPIFVGEIGPSGDLGHDDGTFLTHAVWSSLMTEGSGAAQYWAWDNVERRNLYGLYASPVAFLKASQLAGWGVGEAVSSQFLTMTTSVLGDVSGSPGRGFDAAKRTDFAVSPGGRIEGIEEMPSFLQGDNHRDMFSAANFSVTLKRPGRVLVTVKSAAKAGSRITLAVDGVQADEKIYPSGDADKNVNDTLAADLPAGAHKVTLANAGVDWAVIGRVTFTNAGASRTALGKSAKTHAALYVWRTSPKAGNAAGGADTVTVPPGLAPGRYVVNWWDIATGKALTARTVTIASDRTLVIPVPTPEDTAAYIAPAPVAKRAAKTDKP